MKMVRTRLSILAITALVIGLTKESHVKHSKLITVDELPITTTAEQDENEGELSGNTDNQIFIADNTDTSAGKLAMDVLQPYLIPLRADDSVIFEDADGADSKEKFGIADDKDYYLVVMRKEKDEKRKKAFETASVKKTILRRKQKRVGKSGSNKIQQTFRKRFSGMRKEEGFKGILGSSITTSMSSPNKLQLDTKKQAEKVVAQPEQGIWAWRGKKRFTGELNDNGDDKREVLRRLKENKNKLPSGNFRQHSFVEQSNDMTSLYGPSSFTTNPKKRIDLKKQKMAYLVKRSKLGNVENDLDLEDADLLKLLNQN